MVTPKGLKILIVAAPPFTSAFIHIPLTSPPCHYCTNLASSFDINEHCDNVAEQINHTLQKLRNDILSDPSKLKTIQEQHKVKTDIELTAEELVKETLLSTRLPLHLNRTRIASSTIPDAGRGLFATHAIAKGELITCYPGDALLCEYQDGEEDEEIIDYDEEDEDNESEEVIIWGSHIHINDRLKDDEVFEGREEGMPPLISYAATVDDVYSVMGMPGIDQDPAYYGHFANDGGGHIALLEGDDTMGIEEILSLYVAKSVEVSNARHSPLGGGLHLGTVATRDIKKDEEILVSYGAEYWIDHEF